ncbi:hypothetical protein GLOIN_2v1769820 [Rhizophagus irregularis DAOM 181602=DAOM 197198]|uniref:Uncharacterized protein n=1 Tax=Rhizophagus irregularis (strain DAOM 181602 / DAOM 197198 / MUCL 43194) TaxID=747089 RepID=A0A2P4QDS7_RHIID|nr:hypothetical protein GLOIN_2v1769820 [Rhizophagus irregularis DAOM 181602=DAOM 197198]POG75792.1 hypothetical protein GLOIN_2v1769820 [Rhizophagus irregularis DAOM 181602=DAOM 197198]|eukprot:XP_025182658.1 hypothetical protein GLOIN_2v1769820 [Rhizophagus irregularis DAOM 181602=DAOM 197198]
MSFKKHYRYFHIHWMLKQVEAGERTQDLKMSILQAIQYIIQDFPLDDHEVSDELANALKTLNFSDMMELKEFFNIPEENMKNINDDLDEINNNIKEEVINFSVALKNLKKVNIFLLQQEYVYDI